MSQNVYRDNCLRPILVPYIRKNYPDGDYVFWPDKALSHYTKSVVSFLQGESINFVVKEDNPTNLPQAHQIEDFFGYLDQLVYQSGWSAENVAQLQRRVKACLKKADLEVVRGSMEKVREIGRASCRERV